jgi:hypothetical protein
MIRITAPSTQNCHSCRMANAYPANPIIFPEGIGDVIATSIERSFNCRAGPTGPAVALTARSRRDDCDSSVAPDASTQIIRNRRDGFSRRIPQP